MADQNRSIVPTAIPRFPRLATNFNEEESLPLVTLGLALMEDHPAKAEIETCASALVDSWPIQECQEQFCTDSVARHLALAALAAYRTSLSVDGDDDDAASQRVVAAVKTALREMFENDVELPILAGRSLVSGFLFARASATPDAQSVGAL